MYDKTYARKSLYLKLSAGLNKKPAVERAATRAELRQQQKVFIIILPNSNSNSNPQDEETRSSNPDDILVSDWWSKYYESIGNEPKLKRLFRERDLPRLKLYEKELEKEFDFNDLMQNIPIMKPDNEISDDDSCSDEDEEDQEARNRVGYFKGSIKIYEITDEMYEEGQKEQPKLLFSNLPTNQSADVLVRVYVAAAVGLTPLDFGGNVDPYLMIKCGKTTISDKDRYLVKELNPVFGR